MEPDELRAEIPALQKTIYLNTGASGPSPEGVIDARKDAIEAQESVCPAEGSIYDYGFDLLTDTREIIAQHIGCEPIELALTQSTGDSIARLTAAMDWQEGDVIARPGVEHPAGYLPCERLQAQHGVEVRSIRDNGGRIDEDHFAQVARDARLIVLSSISWTRGIRQDISRLTSIAHREGARVLVDAVQSIGQHPVDISNWGSDAVAASGHKWLLGGWGSGFLYVDRAFAETLRPVHLSYFSVEHPPSEEYELRPGAHRLQIGTSALAPYAGLQAAIETIERLGYDAITSQIQGLATQLKAEIPTNKLYSPPQHESGLVSFQATNPDQLVEQLAEHGVQVKVIRPLNAVRASIHAFNNEDDIRHLADRVNQIEGW